MTKAKINYFDIRTLHETLAILSISWYYRSRKSRPFFCDFYRIGLGSTNTNMVSKHIDIGDIGVGNIDIVLVLTILVKKNFEKFRKISTPKIAQKIPKNGQKLPKFVKICQNLAKNDQNIGFFRKNRPKMTNFFGIGVVLVLQENFFYVVLVSSRFLAQKWLSYWYWVENFLKFFFIVLVSRWIFWPKNLDIGVGSTWPKSKSQPSVCRCNNVF